MPILHVEIVGLAEDFPNDLAQRIADSSADVLSSRPQGTWVKLSYIPAYQYAENSGMDEGVTPVLVSVIQSEIPEIDTLREQTQQLAKAVSIATGVPTENVHIVMEPSARGRIAFGGKLVE